PMSETPLSDLIADHIAAVTPESFARLLGGFRSSMVGVIAVGFPAGAGGGYVSTAEQPISVGLTRHASGRSMVLAFADPAAFARRFGRPFNGEIAGEALVATVLLNPGCEGVLVNSALAEVSVTIDRATCESLARPAVGSEQPARRPRWRFW
ncbi:MAG TPA: hypothetical protein VNS63_12005, partial [Blastocatellia bacterium]|nr:hypothetical protein [Blastocatellia bacterium]